METRSEKDTDKTKAMLKKLQSQKDSLLKELDQLEEQTGQKDALYNKYFPLILDVVASQGGSSFSHACQEISACMKSGSSLAKMNYVFEQLKTALLKEGLQDSTKSSKKGLFSSFKKNPESEVIQESRQDYLEVINGLRSCLGKEYGASLKKLSDQAHHLSKLPDIAQIRESFFHLLFSYIADTQQDREQVNGFVLEISEKIFQIESKLLLSTEHTQSLITSGKKFDAVLQSEMGELKTSSDQATNLDDLKSQITTRLNSIDDALQKKQHTEKAIQKVAAKNISDFKSGFIKLKRELDSAIEHSRNLEKQINQDQLTGAYNRRAYDKRITEEMERFKRYDAVFSLLLIDADKFKKINDSYGHAIGDKCLQEIIKRTMPLLRKNDMLARYGGEEFVIVMPGTDAEGARKAAEKIRQVIEKIEFIYKEDKVRVTVSIGVSQVMPEDESAEKIFERADIAVYQAKDQGRNRVVVYSQE